MVQLQQSYKVLWSRNSPSELLCITGARPLHPCHPQWSKPRVVCRTKAPTTERDHLLSKALLLGRSSHTGLQSTPGALFQLVCITLSCRALDTIIVILLWLAIDSTWSFPSTDSLNTMGAWPETGCSHGSLAFCTALCSPGPPQGCQCSSATNNSLLYGHQLVGLYLHPPF